VNEENVNLDVSELLALSAAEANVNLSASWSGCSSNVPEVRLVRNGLQRIILCDTMLHEIVGQ
jgi:hypothetical protein